MTLIKSALTLCTLLLLILAIGTAGAQPEFIDWVEPEMNAYAAQLPAGWQVQAGVNEVLGTILPNLIAIAPDQSQVLMAGMSETYAFIEPNEALGLTGDATFDIGSTQVGVEPLWQPTEFLAGYLDSMLVGGGTCEQLNVEPQPAVNTEAGYLAGEVTLECRYSGGVATGYFYLGIYVMEDPSLGRLWVPADLYGYLADRGHEQDAEAALGRFVQTLTINPYLAEEVAASYGFGAGDGGMGYGEDYSYGGDYAYGDGGMSADDAMLASSLNSQINQMVNSHMVNTMTNQLNWHQSNMETIMGIRTEYDTQYTYEWVWEPR